MTTLHQSSRGLTVMRYSAEHRGAWDRFVAEGKNATFLFYRGYMDYHSDRFTDHSLMVFKGRQLVGLLPANLKSDETLASHQGLTYGGFVFERGVTLHGVLAIAHAALGALHSTGIGSLVYKRIPRFYNTLPDDEVDYAMFLLDAKLVRRDTAMVVVQSDRLPVRAGKKSQIKQGKRAGVRISEETDFRPFWTRVLAPRLMARHGVQPVHSLAEIELLASRFPGNIRQFCAYAGEQIMAGITIYETPTVAHMQYSAIGPDGDPDSALGVLLEWLIQERYQDKLFFDFGICNEDNGRTLNHGLLRSKENFGARSCVHDVYEVRTADFDRLKSVLPSMAAAQLPDPP